MKQAVTYVEQERILHFVFLICFSFFFFVTKLLSYVRCWPYLPSPKTDIRVGPTVITDPAFLITRTMEDFVTWTDSSKIKKKVMQYNNALDDYDFLDS